MSSSKGNLISSETGRSTHFSKAGIDLIKSYEQLKLKAYLPTPDDVWTIGWGHTKGVTKGMVITEEQANDFLEEDLKWVKDTLNDLVKVSLTQNQYDALGSFIFNIGRTAFAKSTLLGLLNQGKYDDVPNQLRRWNKQNGKVLLGLTRRRAEEIKMWSGK